MKKPATLNEASEELGKSFNALIAAIGTRLYFPQILDWLSKKLSP